MFGINNKTTAILANGLLVLGYVVLKSGRKKQKSSLCYFEKKNNAKLKDDWGMNQSFI